MDELVKPRTKNKARVSEDEMMRRREAIRWADAHNRIEGLVRSPETDSIYESFVHGEIEFDEILPRLRALHHRL